MLQLPQQIFTDSELLKLEIKESSIPNTGMGLFAKEQIEAGEYIAEYYGVIIDEKESFNEPFLFEDKMIFLNKKYCIISRSPASRANDIIVWDPDHFFSEENEVNRNKKIIPTIQGKSRNTLISFVEKDKSFLIASRDIKKGEQIYIGYGFSYWEFFLKKALK